MGLDSRGQPQTFAYGQDNVFLPQLLMQERDIQRVSESESCPSLTTRNTSATSSKESGTGHKGCCNWCFLGWNLHLTGCWADSALSLRQLAEILIPTHEQLIADDSLQHCTMMALFSLSVRPILTFSHSFSCARRRVVIDESCVQTEQLKHGRSFRH